MSTHCLTHYTTPQQAQTACEQMRSHGLSIGFVATMGALHPGHMSLIECARKQNDRVIVSIFVNPLQFNNPEDLKKYPRDDAADIIKLQQHQVDAVFTGSIDDFLGEAKNLHTEQLIDPGIYAQGLEGAHRPGHFEGVREIVSRLFQFVGPCRAYFGEKDYQQLQIIRQLAMEFHGIEVIGCPTSRESGGLARSSRNIRLSSRGLDQAKVIFQAMQAANIRWQQGERRPQQLQSAMLEVLADSDIELEYAEIRDPAHWSAKQPSQPVNQARVLVAGQLEGVRLIDNMPLG